MIDRNAAVAWSILSPTPQCYYHAPTRSHIVYWQGIAMTRVHAMMLIQENWLNSWATPEMKVGAFKEWKRVMLTGGFGQVNWHLRDQHPDYYISQLRKWIVGHNSELWNTLMRDYDIKDAMLWFADSKEELIIDETV